MNDSGTGALDPGIFDDEDAVAHARNQVDEEFPFAGLGKPHWIAQVALKTLFAKIGEGLGPSTRRHEKIEVFRETADAGVLPESEGSRNRVRDVLLLKNAQNLAEQFGLLLGDLGRHRRSDGKSLSTMIATVAAIMRAGIGCVMARIWHGALMCSCGVRLVQFSPDSHGAVRT